MILSAKEFVELRDCDDPRATHDVASLEVWLEVLDCFSEYTRWVIHNETVPVEILEKLSRHEDAAIRSWVATKRKCSLALIDKLSQDHDEYVRLRIAYNAKCPQYILERLLTDPSDKVAETAGKFLAQRNA